MRDPSRPGGLPGYGSHVLMLPERGWGRLRLRQSYLLPPMSRLHAPACRAVPRHATQAPAGAAIALAEARRRGGRLRLRRQRHRDPSSLFAENLLLDMPAPLRDAELARLKQQLGEGRLELIEPTHALAGRFVMACVNGRLRGAIILSPEAEPCIQKLTFAVG